ncbi:MAG: hypothetical protein ACI9HI_002436, partial [Salinirussus sp.]
PDPSASAVALCLLPLAGVLVAGVAVGGLLGVDIVTAVQRQSPLTTTLRGGLAAVSVGLALAIPVVAERLDDDRPGD